MRRFLLAVILCAARPALACSCVTPRHIPDDIAEAQQIFAGRVISIENPSQDRIDVLPESERRAAWNAAVARHMQLSGSGASVNLVVDREGRVAEFAFANRTAATAAATKRNARSKSACARGGSGLHITTASRSPFASDRFRNTLRERRARPRRKNVIESLHAVRGGRPFSAVADGARGR